ncbi:MAG TPA: hypothetical protein VFC74_05870 [Oscillospiraceae bacterium]|nr:hypothetical protein [Oscillospiraceae bacterium]
MKTDKIKALEEKLDRLEQLLKQLHSEADALAKTKASRMAS